MEFFRIKKSIPFMRHALVFNAISFITFLLAVFFLWYSPLHLSIEFTGGAVMEIKYDNPANIEQIKEALTKSGIVGAEPIKFAQPKMCKSVCR